MSEKRWQAYHTLWLWLLLGWVVSYADRAVNGPIVTWMIQHKVSFLMSAVHTYALGGLIGGVFFTGYMLTQFPGGYFGDRFGHRRIITLSLLWAQAILPFVHVPSGRVYRDFCGLSGDGRPVCGSHGLLTVPCQFVLQCSATGLPCHGQRVG
jgi:MFS family permease